MTTFTLCWQIGMKKHPVQHLQAGMDTKRGIQIWRIVHGTISIPDESALQGRLIGN